MTIVMKNGIYCFGGRESPCTSDFLPNGQNEWLSGPNIPEPGICFGHGVAISSSDILLIGGEKTRNKILKFSIDTQKWEDIGSLQQGREDHRCFLYNGHVIITGGFNGNNNLESTEVISLSDFSSRTAGDLNVARGHHYGHS